MRRSHFAENLSFGVSSITIITEQPGDWLIIVESPCRESHMIFSAVVRRRPLSSLAVILVSLCKTLPLPGADRKEAGAESSLRLHLRKRVETFRGSDVWDEVAITKDVPVAETAVIICDMWDKHWCPS